MENFLRSECPHCNQPVEYPAEGTGQTVPCPNCGKLFVLMPAKSAPTPPFRAMPSAKPAPAPAKPLASPTVLPEKDASRPVLSPPASASIAAASPKATPEISRFEQACRELETDPAFAKRPPTREQIGRAWAWAKFQKPDASEPLGHADLVTAMKKLFAEYRDSQPRTETKRH